MPGGHGTPLSCDKHCKKNTQLLTETCSQGRAPRRCDLVVHLVSDRLLLSSDWQPHLRAAQPSAEPRALSPGRKHDCMAAAPETARCSSSSVCVCHVHSPEQALTAATGDSFLILVMSKREIVPCILLTLLEASSCRILMSIIF